MVHSDCSEGSLVTGFMFSARQSSAATRASGTITTGLACGMQFCTGSFAGPSSSWESLEGALVASQALVSLHLMFIFGHCWN